MKAAIYTRYGPPEVITVRDIPKPQPGSKEMLVKVMASSVNRTDCGFRSASYFIVRFFSGLLRPKNRVLGCEYSGIVEQTGNEVQGFKPGDKVFGFNDQRFGGHAEYMIVKETDAVELMPSNFSFEQAAALSEGIHYAGCDLRAAKISSGQDILVNGGTGAIGSAAVQLAKYHGAHVTAVCRTEHLQTLKDLGAETVIDYSKEDFTKLSSKYDIVFDAVGKSTFSKCRAIMKKNSVYISTELGPNSQNPFLALAAPLMGGQKVLFPIPTITKSDLVFFRGLAEAGAFTPLIDRLYSLDEIVDAYRYVETGQKVGNVILNRF